MSCAFLVLIHNVKSKPILYFPLVFNKFKCTKKYSTFCVQNKILRYLYFMVSLKSGATMAVPPTTALQFVTTFKDTVSILLFKNGAS